MLIFVGFCFQLGGPGGGQRSSFLSLFWVLGAKMSPRVFREPPKAPKTSQNNDFGRFWDGFSIAFDLFYCWIFKPVLYYPTLDQTILYYTLDYTTLYCTILRTILYCTVFYCTKPYYTILHYLSATQVWKVLSVGTVAGMPKATGYFGAGGMGRRAARVDGWPSNISICRSIHRAYGYPPSSRAYEACHRIELAKCLNWDAGIPCALPDRFELFEFGGVAQILSHGG